MMDAFTRGRMGVLIKLNAIKTFIILAGYSREGEGKVQVPCGIRHSLVLIPLDSHPRYGYQNATFVHLLSIISA